MLTECDFVIGIIFYMLSIGSFGYWVHYYRNTVPPLVLPNDSDEMRDQRRSLIERRFALSNQMWFLQCVLIPVGTLFLFGYLFAISALIYVAGLAINSYIFRRRTTSSIDYLLERLDTVKAADYAVKEEITRFLKNGCKADEERIRILDYLILRDDVISDTAKEIGRHYEKE